MKQLPVPAPSAFLEPCTWQLDIAVAAWIRPRVLELTYTAWDLEPFARDVLEHACAHGRDLPPGDGLRPYFDRTVGETAPSLLAPGSLPPFRWEEDRCFLLRAEPDAAFFHLYGISREDAAYVMDTFPLVKARDEREHGTYRTRDTILLCYDAIVVAAREGKPYQTLPSPPSADAGVAHGYLSNDASSRKCRRCLLRHPHPSIPRSCRPGRAVVIGWSWKCRSWN